MNSTVYIVQEPVRRNKDSGDFEPIFDLTPAAAYGELVVLLPPGNVMLSPAPMINKLRTQLRNFSDNDFLLAVGDPAAFTAAACIAAHFNRGKYKLLKWDRVQRRYISVAIDTRT